MTTLKELIEEELNFDNTNKQDLELKMKIRDIMIRVAKATIEATGINKWNAPICQDGTPASMMQAQIINRLSELCKEFMGNVY